MADTTEDRAPAVRNRLIWFGLYWLLGVASLALAGAVIRFFIS